MLRLTKISRSFLDHFGGRRSQGESSQDERGKHGSELHFEKGVWKSVE